MMTAQREKLVFATAVRLGLSLPGLMMLMVWFATL